MERASPGRASSWAPRALGSPQLLNASLLCRISSLGLRVPGLEDLDREVRRKGVIRRSDPAWGLPLLPFSCRTVARGSRQWGLGVGGQSRPGHHPPGPLCKGAAWTGFVGLRRGCNAHSKPSGTFGRFIFTSPKPSCQAQGTGLGFSMMTSSTAPCPLPDWLLRLPLALPLPCGLGFPGPSCGACPCPRGLHRETPAGAFPLRSSRRGQVVRGLGGEICRWGRGFITGAVG